MDQYTICIPNLISKTYVTFHLVKLWTNKDTVSIWQYLHFIFFILLFVAISIEAFSTDSADGKVFPIVTTFVAIVQLYRLYCLIWKQKEITRITQETGVHDTDNFEVFSSGTKKLKNGMMLLKIYDSYMVVAFLAVVFIPVFTRQIAFNVAFPLDYENSEVAFWMAYAFVAFGFLLSIICCLFAPIVWYLMINLIIKNDILGSKFRNLFNGRLEMRRKNTPTEWNGLFLKRFVETIKTHSKTNDIIEQFASIFSNLFLIQIVTSSICICGTIYTLAFSNHENLLQDLFYTGVLFYCFVDIFMLMHLGNELTLSSDRLSSCLYESDWIGQPGTTNGLLLIIVERLKKPQKLVVGKIFPLNLRSFGLIVQRAYSMFNILLNFQN